VSRWIARPHPGIKKYTKNAAVLAEKAAVLILFGLDARIKFAA
jgi:hypothetical protein